MAIQIINDSQLEEKALPPAEEPKAEEATPNVAEVVAEPAPEATPEEPKAPEVDPRDAELAALRAELEALKAAPKAPAAPAEPKAHEAETEEDDDLLAEFLADPVRGVSKAMAKALEQEQKAVAARNKAIEEANAEVLKAVPEARELSADPEYHAWVAADPRRAALAARGQRDLDVAVSVTLLSAFKELKNLKAAPAADANQSAALPTGNEALEDALAGGGGEGTVEPTDTRVFRRADIQELAVKDPERYQAIVAEIRQAYLEGRVR